MVQVHPMRFSTEDEIPEEIQRGAEAESSAKNNAYAHTVSIVEQSPTGRFARFNKCMKKYKSVPIWSHLGYDSEKCVEVLWNTVKLSKDNSSRNQKILEKFDKLKEIDHPNISHLYGAWTIDNGRKLVYTTDLPTSRTIEEFVATYPISVYVLRRWCRCILEGLRYLHEKQPPIIHGHLSIDNIYINGQTGVIRLGGLELDCLTEAKEEEKEREENYMEAIQEEIIQFGFCVLDIIKSQAISPPSRAFEAVSISNQTKTAKAELDLLKESDIKRFIETCIFNPKPAAELLKSEMFQRLEKEIVKGVLCSELIKE